jgi:hypothetical protein
MMKDRKDPRTGEKQDEVVAANDVTHAGAHDAGSRSAADRRVEGLLRIIGLQDGNDRELTEQEAELIFDLAEAEPVSDERLARIREGVLRRRFGTTPVAEESPTEASPVAASSIAEAQVASLKAASEPASVRPSLVQHCSSLKRRLADVATELHLDSQTLFELDRGAARAVPRALIEAAAATLRLDRDEVARCLAPGGRDVPRMAAHGRRGAKVAEPAPLRDFLEVIEASKLGEEDKRHWRQVVAAESAGSAPGPEQS